MPNLKLHYEISRHVVTVKIPCFESPKMNDSVDATTDENKVTCVRCLRHLGKLPKRGNNVIERNPRIAKDHARNI